MTSGVEPKVVRYVTRGPNGEIDARVGDVFVGVRRSGSAIIDLAILASFGSATRQLVETSAVVYGRDVPERRERLSLPFALSRAGSETWVLEACKLRSDWPRTTWLLIGVPESVGDGWSARGGA